MFCNIAKVQTISFENRISDVGQRSWPHDQTVFVKHLRFALQEMPGRLATSQNIIRQAEYT